MLKRNRTPDLSPPIPQERQLEIANTEEVATISAHVGRLLMEDGARTEFGYYMFKRKITGMPVVADKLEIQAESAGVVWIGGKWIDLEASADNDRRVYTAQLRWHSSYDGHVQYERKDWRFTHINPANGRPHGPYEGQRGFDTSNAELLVAYNCLAAAAGARQWELDPIVESAGFELLGFPVSNPVTTEAAA